MIKVANNTIFTNDPVVKNASYINFANKIKGAKAIMYEQKLILFLIVRWIDPIIARLKIVKKTYVFS